MVLKVVLPTVMRLDESMPHSAEGRALDDLGFTRRGSVGLEFMGPKPCEGSLYLEFQRKKQLSTIQRCP